MPSIGPQLPPQLSKRKRSPSNTERPSPSKTTRPSNNYNNDHDGSDSDDGYGPSAPKVAAGPTMPPNAPSTRPSIGPAMPPSSTHPTGDDSPEDADDTAAAAPAPPASPRKKRTHGPAPPPAPLSERPPQSADSDSSDSDSYGPALPTARTRKPIGPSMPPPPSAEPERLQRDDWMLLPPTASTGYQERDPTKIKSRKFASGMTATTRPKDGGGGGIASIWTETPQEKAKRLADAVLGRAPADGDRAGTTTTATTTASGGKSGVSGIGSGRDDRIRVFTEQTRGRSLVEEHQAAKKAGAGARKGGVEAEEEEEDDDPSKRAFDREKDMAVGGKITASQRKELLNRASDFGGRFSKGNYL